MLGLFTRSRHIVCCTKSILALYERYCLRSLALADKPLDSEQAPCRTRISPQSNKRHCIFLRQRKENYFVVELSQQPPFLGRARGSLIVHELIFDCSRQSLTSNNKVNGASSIPLTVIELVGKLSSNHSMNASESTQSSFWKQSATPKTRPYHW